MEACLDESNRLDLLLRSSGVLCVLILPYFGSGFFYFHSSWVFFFFFGSGMASLASVLFDKMRVIFFLSLPKILGLLKRWDIYIFFPIPMYSFLRMLVIVSFSCHLIPPPIILRS